MQVSYKLRKYLKRNRKRKKNFLKMKNKLKIDMK